MDWDSIDAFLFDLDGVITPTAELHMRAWAALFQGFLTKRGEAEPYTDADYFRYVDGKPRYDGVRALLASRGITLPDGSPDDDGSVETVCGLGNRKNAVFNEVLARDGIAPYPGSVALMDAVDARGKAKAIVSSSKNARLVLTAAGIIDRFTVIMDGVEAAAQHLPGKPSPDTFQAAARALGVPYGRCVVVEDAVSGVQAGAAGGFGLVVGVERGAGEDLGSQGADIVVEDLGELV
jgi:beta-phosphoglucomutase family hydrolase